MGAFVRKLRQNTGWAVRYDGVTEYGTLGGRPHMHLALFIDKGKIQKVWEPKGENLKRLESQRIRWRQYSHIERELLRAWGCKGSISATELTEERAQYLSKYLVKHELVQKNLLPDQEPEKRSCSPGIGRAGAAFIGDEYRKCNATLVELKDADRHQWLADASTFNWLPGHLPSNRNQGMRTTKKTYPIDRYLRGKIIEYLGGNKMSDQEKRKEERFRRDLAKLENLPDRERRKAKAVRMIRRKSAERGGL